MMRVSKHLFLLLHLGSIIWYVSSDTYGQKASEFVENKRPPERHLIPSPVLASDIKQDTKPGLPSSRAISPGQPSNPAPTQNGSVQQNTSSVGQRSLDGTKKEEQPQKASMYRTLEYNSLNKRDPFKNLLKKKETRVLEPPGRETRPIGIRGMLIAEVKLTGIASGVNGENLAVLYGPDRKAHFAYEGDRLYDGYVKSITPEGVRFIKESKFSSGEVRRREIVVPLYPSTQ